MSLQGYSGGSVDDAGGADTGRAADGGNVDAPSDPGRPGWCATHAPDASFCADFDDGRGLDAFDETYVDNASVSVDDGASRSPPASVLAVSGPKSGGANAQLIKLVPNAPTRATVSFDVRLESAHPNVGAELVHFRFAKSDGERDYTVGFGTSAGAGATYAYVYAPTPSLYEEFTPREPIPLGTWVRFVLTVDLPAKVFRIERDDGQPPVTETIDPPPTNALSLEVGLAYASEGKSGWKVRMDNVVFDGN